MKARETIEREGLGEVIWVPQPAEDPRIDQVCQHILDRRRHKGMTESEAEILAQQALPFAASLVALGHADASVAGAVHTTGDVIRAGLQFVGLAEGITTVSSLFLMVKGDEALSFADGAVVPSPDSDQLAAIAKATSHNHELFTGEPARVAFLSFSTKGSAEHDDVQKVRAALERFRNIAPDVDADGELQFDAAYVDAIAKSKAPGSPVAGKANVFVFPDLNAGNIGYKIAQRLGGYAAFGPVVQGLAKPCLDLSRGCNSTDIVNTAVLASIMAPAASS